MYLTAGLFKGIKIEVPNDVKPTLSKVRQSVFNMLLQFEFSDNSFLDMFSGSGIMGLEAVSRGYEVLGLELNPKTASIIKKNYLKIKKKPNLVVVDCLKFKTEKKFSIIYLDPPWQDDYVPILKKSVELLKDDGVIFVEYDEIRKLNLEEIILKNKIPLKIFKSKKYGRCLIDVLVK